MRRPYLSLLSLTLVGGLTVAGSPEAWSGPQSAPKGWWNFEALDANTDGFIDKDELTSQMNQRFESRVERLDTDKDGVITEAEHAEWRAERESQGRRRAGRMAKKGFEGPVTVEELRTRHTERVGRRFARVDTDQDGRVSPDEFEAARERWRNRRSRRAPGVEPPRAD